MNNFSKLLIANRGEIAVRIMSTAKKMGIQTVAVYSDADVEAKHVKYADDAVYIGSSAANESYLIPERILEAAKCSGAQAIHPGYGFLSENAEFAQLVHSEGLIYVGPPEDAIRIMGDKAMSKRAMIDAGVACLPGYQGADQTDKTLVTEAKKIGFPLMVKAAAGGGGRGMRLVKHVSELPNAIRIARMEAKSAFGSNVLIIERAVVKPRHVEIQIFADAFGHVVHLGERDCSVQRRHQKIIEEAPCPIMTHELRTQMGNAAIKAAKAVNYIGAGTVEFLLDKNGAFYFLEMNTRLQVEHPVTEMITGLDLVAMQLRTAQGETLGFAQSDIKLQGHAIEVRLYAEDPDADFLPCAGPVIQWIEPNGMDLRVDSGIESGGEVSPFYDPLVAKIIAFGANREEARRKLITALDNTALFGIKTNRDFLIESLRNQQFVQGKATTSFIDENFPKCSLQNNRKYKNTHMHYAVAAVLQHVLAMQQYQAYSLNVNSDLLGWSSTANLRSLRCYEINAQRSLISICARANATRSYRVSLSEIEIDIRVLSISDSYAKLIVNKRRLSVIFHSESEKIMHLAISGAPIFTVRDISTDVDIDNTDFLARVIKAPMHGVIIGLEVSEGQEVKIGQPLVILEAMKMQHSILAPTNGSVKTLNVKQDERVAINKVLLEIEN
ncbi:acetyl/propionyl/methylcrotonyl-CoA carboxylase subunit alpha [Microbulbifer sp. 2304DJ12-6]|uniref:acetyl/propionyl/methylcrotonyl-CoA carboxylase subunit alpha n=1 Tax=Microbulbifer sp. 2304DJ12-6 TaxID=3233340 RepID=UPI0039AFB9F2